jgi:hypothetical protein
MKKKIIAVVGATKAPGRGLIRAMLDDKNGEFVPRAVVRDLHNEEARFLTAQGVEVVAGRIGHEASLRLAFTGAHGAFYIMLPDEQSLPEKKIGEATTMARAAKATGLQHVVWATLEDTSRPPVDEEELTPALGPDGGKARKVDVKGEINKVFTSLGVATTYLQATWHAAVVTGKWAEEIGKCAYGIFRSPELLNKTVSIDAGLLALGLAQAPGRGAPAPAGGLRSRRLLIGAGAGALALALVLALVLGHGADPHKSDVPTVAAAVPTTPVAPAPEPSVAPPPRAKVVPFNSHGLRAPVAAPAARPQPEHEPAPLAMRSAPLPPASRNRVRRRFSHKGGGRQQPAEVEAAIDEQPRAIPAEPVAPVRTTPAADVRKQPEARKPAPEPAPAPAPEAERPVEKVRETRQPAAVQKPAPPAAAAAPAAAALAPGTVDPKSVAATVRAHAPEVQGCFERALMDAGGTAELHGHLNVSATIDPTGHVISVWPTSSIEGGSRLQACVLGAFKDWVFAPPVGGVKGRIKYSFSFE